MLISAPPERLGLAQPIVLGVWFREDGVDLGRTMTATVERNGRAVAEKTVTAEGEWTYHRLWTPRSTGTWTLRVVGGGPEPYTQRIRVVRRPAVRRFGISTTLRGEPGPDVEVVVAARFTACASPGRLSLAVREQLLLGDDVFGEHFRRLTVRQRSRCQRHTVRWRLRDEFVGVGKYSVRLALTDRFFVESRAAFASILTTD